jgi:uncharacterized protein DUF3311
MPNGVRRNWPLLLLALPFVFLLIPQIYNRIDPQLFGIPFFVWYQFAWVILGSVITFTVYRLRSREER